MDNTARNHEADLEALRAVNATLLDGLLGLGGDDCETLGGAKC